MTHHHKRQLNYSVHMNPLSFSTISCYVGSPLMLSAAYFQLELLTSVDTNLIETFIEIFMNIDAVCTHRLLSISTDCYTHPPVTINYLENKIHKHLNTNENIHNYYVNRTTCWNSWFTCSLLFQRSVIMMMLISASDEKA